VVQIDGIEHHRLSAAQTERVDRLQQLGIPQRAERTLSPGAHEQLDAGVGRVKQALNLVVRERATLPIAFKLEPVRHRVPRQTHLRGDLPKLAIADLHPVVQRVREVVTEPTDRPMVGAHRRQRPSATARLSSELIHIRDSPPPRRFVHEITEPCHRRRPVPDRLLTEPARQLLVPPTIDHRTENLRFRVRQCDVRC
jgi:hypothetical protein